MRNLSKLRVNNRTVPEFSQTSHRKKSFLPFGLKLWNNLLYYIKSSKNLESLKRKNNRCNGKKVYISEV